MEELINQLMRGFSLPILFLIAGVTIYTLMKGADLLVEESVALSARWGIPKVLIGATIVSLGTTLPEAAVSVLAAIKGSPGLALGNAVGSIICNTGLVLGTAALISPLPITKSIVKRQGWIQIASAFMLVFASIPYFSIEKTFIEGGRFSQKIGFAFLVLLIIYIWKSITWVQNQNPEDVFDGLHVEQEIPRVFSVFLKMIFAFALVVISCWILIPAVSEIATRLKVPESIIAATLVAFGTSLPEFVTAVTAARKGHGELAIGNVIGANILNVLFVVGAASAVTRGGLAAPVAFFKIFFPAMLFILSVLMFGIFISGSKLKRSFGFILLGTYIFITILSYSSRIL